MMVKMIVGEDGLVAYGNGLVAGEDTSLTLKSVLFCSIGHVQICSAAPQTSS